jgi:hypothetical protein
MKWIFTTLVLFSVTAAWTQSPPCELLLSREAFVVGDTLSFDVNTGSLQELEVSVFADNQVLFNTTDKLGTGLHTYRVLTDKASPGSYYVLVKGEGIHEQRSVSIR